ncbi:MAG TPA: 1,4-dihydroxy-2-naphthoate octaprenyltransferase [Candidatus Binataceae bacterium]|nr:1,4-dihydroxy-2-naphthoate octaprenyltransferase [Candidatus Binataceae bacterium]
MDQAGTISLPGGSARPGFVATWIQASRAWTLGMPFISVSVGTAAAVRDGFFSPWIYLAAALGAVFLQAGANMVNDYYDFANGTDSADWNSPESFGPGLVIQRGFLRPEQVWWGGIVALVIGSIFGIVLVAQCGWPVLVLGLIGVAGAYFYTASPLSLAYRGLGDLMVFTLMGPGYVLGAYYVQAVDFSWAALVASLPMGFLCSGVLQANNLRDIDNDRAHGKSTFAVLVGRRAALIELLLSDVGAYVATLAGVAARLIPWPAIFVLVTLPRPIDQLRLVWPGPDAEKHNRAMSRSGQLQFELGLLLVIAFVLGRFFGW